MSEQNKQRFSETTRDMLYEAGWFPGRDVSGGLTLPPGFVPFPVALRVLNEFGALRIGQPGPGVDSARQHLVIDPMLALGEDDRLGEFADHLHTNMHPLGETDYGHAFLVIDEQGQVFEIFEDLYFVADGFDAALENLLNGLNRPRMVDADGHW